MKTTAKIPLSAPTTTHANKETAFEASSRTSGLPRLISAACLETPRTTTDLGSPWTPVPSIARDGASDEETDGCSGKQRRPRIVFHKRFHIASHAIEVIPADVVGGAAESVGRRVR